MKFQGLAASFTRSQREPTSAWSPVRLIRQTVLLFHKSFIQTNLCVTTDTTVIIFITFTATLQVTAATPSGTDFLSEQYDASAAQVHYRNIHAAYMLMATPRVHSVTGCFNLQTLTIRARWDSVDGQFSPPEIRPGDNNQQAPLSHLNLETCSL